MTHEGALFSEEFRGCAVLDCGATVGTSSLAALDEIQEDRLTRKEQGEAKLAPSQCRFRFANGTGNPASVNVTQPITAGLLEGSQIDLHVVDQPGNLTPPLFSIEDMRKHRLVVDFEENAVSFKDRPGVWHSLPCTQKGLLLMPLTEEAVQRFKTSSDKAMLAETQEQTKTDLYETEPPEDQVPLSRSTRDMLVSVVRNQHQELCNDFCYLQQGIPGNLLDVVELTSETGSVLESLCIKVGFCAQTWNTAGP